MPGLWRAFLPCDGGGLFFQPARIRGARVVDAMGIHATDHFRGLLLKGELPAETWLDFLDLIPVGLTELMVHPGRADASLEPFAGFSTAAREKELAALTDGRFLAALLKTDVC